MTGVSKSPPQFTLPAPRGHPLPKEGETRIGIYVCALLGCVAGSLGGQVPVQLRQANG